MLQVQLIVYHFHLYNITINGIKKFNDIVLEKLAFSFPISVLMELHNWKIECR